MTIEERKNAILAKIAEIKQGGNTYAEHRLIDEKLEEMEKRLANGRCT